MTRKTHLVGVAAATLAVVGIGMADLRSETQTFEKPIRLIVGFKAGGRNDTIARRRSRRRA